ncbi:MAG: trigger factor [Patescibacteria group bacterium]|nr:trigger factor [Patescibacteria group bacterium]MDD3777986.1 trigger factor [Patescibacteria group bacterium]MDD3939200.1 trigger factor [Patescibacteria group bacterium]
MKVTKKELEKSQIEVTIELSLEEFKPYIEKGALKVSEKVKIEGFRPGKVPYDVLKQKIGEMTILEEAAHIAIMKTVDDIIEKETAPRQPVGQPSVNITKLAPGNPLEYKVTLALLPMIEIGEYKGLKLKVQEAKIDKKDLELALQDLREARAQEKLVDREIKDGDKALVDVDLFLSKVPIEDGNHKNLPIKVGKDYFVPGFDKNLLGLKKGDTKEFSLVYPKKHHRQNLADKKVDFKIKINDVYEIVKPELDDKFAAQFQLKNIEELNKALEENLLNEKKRKTDLKNESEMIAAIVAKTKFGDFPDVLVDNESNNLMSELEENIIRQGGKFEDYLKHLNKSRNELMLEMMPNAIKRVKSALIIREIAIREEIAPTDKEIEEKIKQLKEQYQGQDNILKMFEEAGYRSYLKNILTNEKVIEKLKEWNYANTGNQQKS